MQNNLQPNNDLANIWMEAAKSVRDLNQPLWLRLMDKASYWSNPNDWTQEKIKQANITLDAIRIDAKKILDKSRMKSGNSFWKSTIGTITKVTALIIAITGLIVAIKQLNESIHSSRARPNDSSQVEQDVVSNPEGDVVPPYLVTQGDGKPIPISKNGQSALFDFTYNGSVKIIVDGAIHADDCKNLPGTTWDKTLTLFLNGIPHIILENGTGSSCNLDISTSSPNSFLAHGKTFVTIQASKSDYQFGGPHFTDRPIVLETGFKISVVKTN